MINQLKKLILFKLLIPVIWQKMLTITKKNSKIEMKILDHNHDKYISTPKHKKLTVENFVARSA